MKFSPKTMPMTSKALFTIVGGAVLINPVFAQDQTEEIDTVVVTGIKSSLKASMDVKRDSQGVVDAITAEDIGKFPDTNLAESLQRISGVSIDRVAGEGSRITARGFGPGFNLVTVNGRAMPVADAPLIGGGADAEYRIATDRAFDMSNLASEGVSGIEVYKTGRASITSGGIGATVNLRTVKPLEAGTRASVGVKAMYDTSVETGDDITPEASGLLSWANDADNFGVSFFGSFQKRDSALVGGANQDWNVERLDLFMTRVAPGATVTNLPTGNPLIVFPNESSYVFSEVERERINGQLTVQFRPMDALTLTLDGLFASNEQDEQRSAQSNWFNRPFSAVAFDNTGDVSTVTFLQDTINNPKDMAFSQQLRAVKDELTSVGFNADWKIGDRFGLEFDAHTSSAESSPNGRGGIASYDVGVATQSVAAQTLDLSTGFPVQAFSYNDAGCYGDPNANGPGELDLFPSARCQNNNGVIDVADASATVGRTTVYDQTQDVDQFRLEGKFSFSDNATLTGGVDVRQSSMTWDRVVTAQVLGDWGGSQPGDIEAVAPGVLETYCLSCLFDDFNPGQSAVAFRGNAADLYNALSPYYQSQPFVNAWQASDPTQPFPHRVQTWNNDHNQVDEDISSVYAEYAWNGELGGRESKLNVGVRYEQTDVTAEADVSVPSAIVWTGDNDFAQDFAGGANVVTEDADYSHVLPNLDFSVEILDNVVMRASWSKTIARPPFPSMFVQNNAGNPPRATALGGIATGSIGNPGLVPLESRNLDLSLEVYYGDASYVSIGFFDKDVDNFIGTGSTSTELFGLRDASSGAPGTRSGQAVALINATPGAQLSDTNLFVATAMIANPGAFANPAASFQAGLVNGNFANAQAIFDTYDIRPLDSGPQADPFFSFQVAQPINQRKANIHGAEIAFQHFFGESGFGLQGNYTVVDGDVGFNNAGDPGINQFALLGLSDTANATVIFEKFGLSARLAWNWRDTYLDQANFAGFRNPVYFDSYRQWDMNVSYDVSENLQVSLEAVNITGEDTRSFGRTSTNYWVAQDLHPRYLLGARYRFQ